MGNLKDRYRGSLLGLAAGDALGTTLEFKSPGSFQPIDDMVGGGPFGLNPGQWTDDTSMALCLAESLIKRQGFDPTDQMRRYVRWWRKGHLSSTGTCFDIGGTTSSALSQFERTGDPFSGPSDPHSAGNGSIMRLAPVPLFFAGDPEEAIQLAGESSRTTHGAQEAVDACRYLAGLVVGALEGRSREELLSECFCPVPELWDRNPLAPKIAAIAVGSFKHLNPPALRGTGYVVDSLEAALWAFHHSQSFVDGALLAVNLGDDADTTGAVYGQLAGAYYGADGIPEEWRHKLAYRQLIEKMADQLCEMAGKGEVLPAVSAPTSNRQIFDRLMGQGKIRLQPGSFLDTFPSPLASCFSWDRIEGMMLGLAIGDSLGNTSESLLPGERENRFGEIRDYLPNALDGSCVGLPSDDTQLAFWTLEQLVEDGRFEPESVARSFCEGRIYGLGSTVRGFLQDFKSGQKAWHEAGPHSAGNGALMRIAPIVIPHLRVPSSDLWSDTVLSAMTTHNDATSTAACVSFTNIIWQLLSMDHPPEPEWWLETYVSTAREMEGETHCVPRGGEYPDYQGPLWKFVEQVVSEAYEKQLSVSDACRGWYSGAFLLETVPTVLYILMRHGDDFEEALVRAVNDTKDNDTIAAIVGAVLGALHGKMKIPERWIENLAGHTRDSDKGHVFELLDKARQVFWKPDTKQNIEPCPIAQGETCTVPFDRSYWVVPGQLLAGFYPGAPTLQEAEKKLCSLLDVGVRCVVNLVEEDEKGYDGRRLHPYQLLLSEIAVGRGIEVSYVRIPIRDLGVPLAGTMQIILDLIDAALARGQVTYVHCWGGRGRTGTVVGCYLARHGMATGEEALKQIAYLRRQETTANKGSPDTEDQRKMIRQWCQGE